MALILTVGAGVPAGANEPLNSVTSVVSGVTADTVVSDTLFNVEDESQVADTVETDSVSVNLSGITTEDIASAEELKEASYTAVELNDNSKVFKFVPAESALYQLCVTSDMSDVVDLNIYDSNMCQIYSNSCFSLMNTDLQQGSTYYIELKDNLSGDGKTLQFDFIVQIQHGLNDVIPNAEEMQLSGDNVTSWEKSVSTDVRYATYYDQAVKMVVENSGKYCIKLKTNSVGYMGIDKLHGSPNIVTENDNSFINMSCSRNEDDTYEFYCEAVLGEGVYYILLDYADALTQYDISISQNNGCENLTGEGKV